MPSDPPPKVDNFWWVKWKLPLNTKRLKFKAKGMAGSQENTGTHDVFSGTPMKHHGKHSTEPISTQNVGFVLKARSCIPISSKAKEPTPSLVRMATSLDPNARTTPFHVSGWKLQKA